MAGANKWPKAVFTDSKNTLWEWDPVWIRSCAGILEKYGSDMDPEQFWRVWIRWGVGENHRAAFAKYESFTETLELGLEKAFQITGIPGTRDDVKFMTDLWGDVPPYPDTAPGLAKVQSMGVPVLIYSNVETEYLDMMVDKLEGFRPAFVGDMEKSHSRKPSPRAYRWVLDTAGRELGIKLDYPDILYVAGPQWDVQGAMALGMKGVWVRRNLDIAIDCHVGTEPQGVEPDYTVDDMYGVAEIVERCLAES